jgi:hypothetical protein
MFTLVGFEWFCFGLDPTAGGRRPPNGFKTQVTRISIRLLVAVTACGLNHPSFGEILTPSMQVGECLFNTLSNCSRPIDRYASGQTIMQMSSDTMTIDDTTIIHAEAGAGGGLEPAASARAYQKSSASFYTSVETYAAVNDWAYRTSGPAVVDYVNLAIEFNWSIEGSGQVSFTDRLAKNNYGISQYFYAERRFRGGQYMQRFSSTGAWSPSPNPIEGSGVYRFTDYPNQFFYLSVFVSARADNTNVQYSQVAVDPYVMIDPDYPNGRLFEVGTIKGFDDSALVSPVRGSALAAPVPEPAAGVLMLAGLVLLGAAARRERQLAG